MAEIVLNVEVRENTGTGGARTTRREGLVPGILYGGDKAPVAISVKMNEFKKALYTGKLLGHLVTLKHGALANVGMPPMTMAFKAKDAAMVKQVKEGDKVKVRVENVDGTLTIVRLEKQS